MADIVRSVASLSVPDLLTKFSTHPDGLSVKDAAKRLLEHGPNEISGQKSTWYSVLLSQFRSPFLYLLVFAGGVAFFVGERNDALMIFLFVSVNTGLGFYQEYKSEKTLQLLKHFVQAKVKVMREGKHEQVLSSSLVPGDLVFLVPGDIVPADIRLIDEESITIDESVLTGESAPVRKETTASVEKRTFGSLNMAYAGTSIVSGEGKGIVVATGQGSAIGTIATVATETAHSSTFEKGISRLSNFILKVIVLTLVGVLIGNLLLKGGGTDFLTLLVFAIALAISVIPEALPVVTTFSLSRGALHLARHKVVVKRLAAVEDLGSIEVLCSDKTGTLTENVLTEVGQFPMIAASETHLPYLTTPFGMDETVSDPFDSAILAKASSRDRELLHAYEKVYEVPFTPQKRLNSILFRHNKDFFLIVRGALEAVLPLCEMTHEQKAKLTDWAKEEGVKGHRVICIAKKRYTKRPLHPENEEKLSFLTLLSFEDPLKKTAVGAIAKAERLGVQVKILTGDSPDVAGAVAYDAGLISDRQNVVTGEQFDGFSDEKKREIVMSTSVFARVSPVQKHAIVKLLQEKREVGFLGEGINDAPALKAANVAIVVQSASDIARDAADIILLHKSLDVVVDGIYEGREIFGNTVKYIKATLASNFGNFYTVAIASLFIPFLPLLPLQILLINLLTDFPMIAVSTDTIDSAELKRPKNYDVKEIALFATIMGIVSTVFDFLFFLLFYKISPGVLQTNWFIGSVLTELLFLFAIRTKLPVWRAKFASLPLVLFSLIAALIAIILPFTGFGRTAFFFVTPTSWSILLIILVTVSYFVVTEFVKQLYYKFVNGKNASEQAGGISPLRPT